MRWKHAPRWTILFSVLDDIGLILRNTLDVLPPSVCGIFRIPHTDDGKTSTIFLKIRLQSSSPENKIIHNTSHESLNQFIMYLDTYSSENRKRKKDDSSLFIGKNQSSFFSYFHNNHTSDSFVVVSNHSCVTQFFLQKLLMLLVNFYSFLKRIKQRVHTPNKPFCFQLIKIFKID